MRVLVTGSRGLIGTALIERLQAGGHRTTRLVRCAPGAGEVAWDPAAGAIDRAGLEGHDAVVHLAGEGIGDHRWTAAHKARVLDSRKAGTRLLTEALAGLDQPPAVLVSASAVGYYGDRGDEVLTEESTPGSGFLADVVREWEAATAPATDAGIRTVLARTGIVLSDRGGALAEMLPIFKLGAGGRLGSGRQWWSWISLDDHCAVIERALADTALSGPLNSTAPNPVTNAVFTSTLGRVLRRPAIAPVPKVALAIRFGREMAEEMLLAGQRVRPARLEAAGFTFAHPELEGALRAILGR